MSLVKVPRWRFCHSSRVTRVTRVTRQMSPDLVISVKIMHFNAFLLHSEHVSLYLSSPKFAEWRKSRIFFTLRISGSKDTRRRALNITKMRKNARFRGKILSTGNSECYECYNVTTWMLQKWSAGHFWMLRMLQLYFFKKNRFLSSFLKIKL